MNGYTAARTRYVDNAVSTASPATLLVMLYDRLLRDLERGELAFREGMRSEGSAQLLHAQDIVTELASTLDVDAWDGGPQLMSLYNYLATSLVEANIAADPDKVAACKGIVEPLHAAWEQAARQAAEAAPDRAVGDLGVA
ncbi:flagellar export chaperone FliS [Demequina capsici]|uniref:Flagellar export chaperone FliS n=1 Tax=Demequina capsici TaxID=3075620 RepID=A0AA96F6R7_9MICO|nr:MULTISPECIES: flagellar export chaperone FliS [unclassified Demequina]WNM24547.1 flagellar export chaperone FliS [Demequina sp. OYTSA14]WNM27398.1 flagellar export chaperone FliS [Demequina sp. PMTSA13]